MGFPIDTAIDSSTDSSTESLTGKTHGSERTESMSAAQWIAAAGGLGLAPIAPGTFGSLGGAALFLGVMWLGLTWIGEGSFAAFAGLYLLLTAVLFGLGVWASGRAEREWNHHDDQRIVIDEVVGQLVALSPLVWFFGLRPALASSSRDSSAFLSVFLPVVTGFVLFRLFDVWKPGAVRWAECHFESGLGVMADDVVAGVYSAVVLALVLVLFWGFGLNRFEESASQWSQWSGALTDIGFRSLGSGTLA